MACTNCIQTTASITGFVPNTCQSTNPCFLDSGCVYYTGPTLSCSGITTNTSLESILQIIDPLLCAATGDYSTYNTFCLAPISTQKEFVESISDFVCTLDTTVTTFIDTTFPAYQASVTASLSAINNPAITCASANVISSDTLNQLLVKYCTKFATIDTALSLSTVTWSSCYTVSPTPTTIAAGFNVLIAQICLLKAAVASGAILPIFNNTGTCLASPGTADSLVSTIGKIITRLCLTGTLNTSTLTWGCTTNSTSSNTDLQGALQAILTQITTVSQAEPRTWSADFVVTNVDNGNLCLGKHIALATPLTQDRFVAATAGDASPGTLQSKLIAGTNITLDFSTPTQVTINSSGGAGVGDHKVIADSSDTVPDYLIGKLEGGTASFGVSVIPFLDTADTSHQVALNTSVDAVALFTALLNALDDDAGLKALFCSQIQSCPSPCSAPSNVTVTYTPGTTTTSTTTTTTTTT